MEKLHLGKGGYRLQVDSVATLQRTWGPGGQIWALDNG